MHVPITKWYLSNEPDDNLIYKNGVGEQVVYFRDTIGQQLLGMPGYVVSTHTSKSCKLPVVEYSHQRFRLRVRANFFNYAFILETERKVPYKAEKIASVDNDYDKHSVYYEGFPATWFESKEDDPYGFDHRLQGRIGDKFSFYTFVWACKEELIL